MVVSRYCVIHPDTEQGSSKFCYSDQWVDVEHQASKSPRPTKESYKFDRVFTPGCSQEKVYQEVAKQAVLDALRNISSAAFIAVGPSGAGKTFLITGGAKRFADRGLIPRSISTLFDALSARPDAVDFQVSISFYEIYKDSVVDLLTPPGRRVPWPVDGAAAEGGADGLSCAHSSAAAGEGACAVVPPGLERCPAETESDAYQLLFHGDSHRHFDMLLRNAETSLGHVFFVVYLKHTPTAREAALTFVDLAAEIGIRSHAAMSISWSLNALRAAVAAMRDGRTPPFGASLLTRLMRPFLQVGPLSPPCLAFLHPVHLTEATLEEQREWLSFAAHIREAMSPAGTAEGMEEAHPAPASAPALVPPTLSAVSPAAPASQASQQAAAAGQTAPASESAALLATSFLAEPVQRASTPAGREGLLRRLTQQQPVVPSRSAEVADGSSRFPAPPVEVDAGPLSPAHLESQQSQSSLKLKADVQSSVVSSACFESVQSPSLSLPNLRGDDDDVEGPPHSALLASETSLPCSAHNLPAADPGRQGASDGNSSQPEPEPSGAGSTSEGGTSKVRPGNVHLIPADRSRSVTMLRQRPPNGFQAAPLAQQQFSNGAAQSSCAPKRDAAMAAAAVATGSTSTSACAVAPPANGIGADAAGMAGIGVDAAGTGTGSPKVPQPVRLNSLTAPSAPLTHWQRMMAAPGESEATKRQWRFAAASHPADTSTGAADTVMNPRQAWSPGRGQEVQQAAPPPLRMNQGARLSNCASEPSFFFRRSQGPLGPQPRSSSPETAAGSRVAAPPYWLAARPVSVVGSGDASSANAASSHGTGAGQPSRYPRSASASAIWGGGSAETAPHSNAYTAGMRWAPPAAGPTSGPPSRAQSPAQMARSISPMGCRQFSHNAQAPCAQSRSLPRASVLPMQQQVGAPPCAASAGPTSPLQSPHDRTVRGSGVYRVDVGSCNFASQQAALSMDVRRAQAGWVTSGLPTVAPGQGESPPRPMTPHRTAAPMRGGGTPQRTRADYGSGAASVPVNLQWRPPAVGGNSGSPVRSVSPTPATVAAWQAAQEQPLSRQAAQYAQSPLRGQSPLPQYGSGVAAPMSPSMGPRSQAPVARQPSPLRGIPQQASRR